ncbi:polysaccharide deacetylase [Halalkalicoccus jeotgali B3]|uniref:Polysaccharide deacetylase n=2 Tax=Halalkalicoccus jeotgali TaxID=413810 RepID=D8J5R0_HALJB|nr:polysaccharide deacetylase [Halalkalicoccus jeotgali B3]ELY34237.1 polysaccharide deacetylase [Halalkalicoccus jeotgali B3]
MRAIGAGAATIGVSGLSGTAGAQEDAEPAGYLSLIYDDGPVEDYEMYRVHQQYGVPGCTAACPGLLNSSENWLSSGQVLEMSDNGWEFMSHTIRHRALGEIPIVEDIATGDTRIYPEATLHGRFEGDPIVVFDEELEAEATVAGNGEDDTGPYIELESGIDESFTAGSDTRVRYTEEFLRQILTESKAGLEEYVREDQVTNLIYPYERDDGLVSELAPEYYVATPTRDGVGLNPEYNPDPYGLGRRYMETDRMTESDIETFLDNVAEEPDYGILAGHSEYDTLPPERVDFVLQQAQERNIQVVTVQEALDIFGVAPEPERNVGGNDSEPNNEPAGGGNVEEDEESMGFIQRILAFFRSLFN